MNNDKDARGNILDLRTLLQEKFGSAQAGVSSPSQNHGTLDLNAVRPGTVCEIVAAASSSGVALLVERLLVKSKGRNHVALIDGRDSFDPQLADNSLNHILWLRCRNAQQVMKAADWLLRDGNLSLVVLDLQLNPSHETRRIPASSWYRLRALAKETDTALLVFSAIKLLPRVHARWLLRESFSISAMDEIRGEIPVTAVLEKGNPSQTGMMADAIARVG